MAPVTAQDIRPTARGWGAVRAAETWTAVAEVRGQVIWRHPDLEDGELVPAGTEVLRIDPAFWVTLARKDHPACAARGIEAWRRYPHVMVNVTRSMRNPFPVPSQGDAGARRVSAMIGDSACVASLLEKSDFLATFPAMLLAWDMEAFGLRAMKPPVDLGPVLVRFFWSARLASDAGGVWIRSVVIEAYRRLQAEAAAKLSGSALLLPEAPITQ